MIDESTRGGAPSTGVPAPLRNLYLESLKALLSQERSALDEIERTPPARRRALFERLCGDARSLRGDAAAFGFDRVSEIGSTVEALIAEFLATDEAARSQRNGRSVIDALAGALRDLDAEVRRAEAPSTEDRTTPGGDPATHPPRVLG